MTTMDRLRQIKEAEAKANPISGRLLSRLEILMSVVAGTLAGTRSTDIKIAPVLFPVALVFMARVPFHFGLRMSDDFLFAKIGALVQGARLGEDIFVSNPMIFGWLSEGGQFPSRRPYAEGTFEGGLLIFEACHRAA